MKKQKPTMEELFATMPPEPEDLREEIMRHADPVPIFYKRRGRYADCICGKCAMGFTREETPSRGDKTHCPYCGIEGEYQWMRCTLPVYQNFTVILIQRRTDNNLLIRYYRCYIVTEQGKKQHSDIEELRRQFLNMGEVWKFNHNPYTEKQWDTKGAGIMYEDFYYPGWIDEVGKSNLRYFDYKGYGTTLAEELRAYANNPGIEIFEKVGMHKLTKELIENGGKSQYINRRGKTLKAQLRLREKNHINWMRENNGSLTDLAVLCLEEKNRTSFTEEQRKFVKDEMTGYWGGKEKIAYMMKHMSIVQLFNRVVKYTQQEGKNNNKYNRNATLGIYYDYLKMREELGYDMKNEVFIHPKNLEEKHDEMVEEKHKRQNDEYEKEMEQKFGKIREKFETLKKKYSFESDGLTIRPAESATEIIREGRRMHHCVGGENYLRKHNNGNSTILLLRHSETPDQVYYTIEIRGEKILQWYGKHDKKPDKEIVEPWLNRYVEHLEGKIA